MGIHQINILNINIKTCLGVKKQRKKSFTRVSFDALEVPIKISIVSDSNKCKESIGRKV